MTTATEKEQWIVLFGMMQKGIDSGFGSLHGSLTERTEDDVGDGVEPVTEMKYATVDDAGVGNMDGDAVAISAVQLFSKEHHSHLAVSIGSYLAVAVGSGVKKVVVKVRHITAKRDGADHVCAKIHQRQEPSGEKVGAEVVGGGDALEAFGGGFVMRQLGTGIVEQTVDADVVSLEAMDKGFDGGW